MPLLRRSVLLLLGALSLAPSLATAQTSAAFPTVIEPYTNAVTTWNRWYPVGWTFTASQSLSVTALGLWLPDNVTSTSNFTSTGHASYAVGLSRAWHPSAANPDWSFAPYPSARATVTGTSSMRGEALAGGAFWYTPIAPFDIAADETFSLWIDLADIGVYAYGFFHALHVSSHGLDPRLSYQGSWQADGAWLNGDPLYVFDGPGIGEGPNPIIATIGGNFLIAAPVTAVPEPSALWMVLPGVLVLAVVSRRHSRAVNAG